MASVKTIPSPDRGRDMLGSGRTFGAADLSDGDAQSLIEEIRNRMHCSVMALKNIESTTVMLGGPQLDTVLSQSFGAVIDPMSGMIRNPQINGRIETTLAQPGEPQTYSIICAIGWQLEPEPFSFSAPCNAWLLTPGAQNQPASPNAFTYNDFNNNALGLGAPPAAGTVFVPGSLWWGGWANYAAWCMVRGYNLRWQVGQNTNLIFQRLRNVAYMPDSAQPGSASSSLLASADFFNRTNAYYRGLVPTTLTALKLDTTRIGSVTAGGVNVGIFNPNTDFDLVQATYGGIGLREELRCNSEFMMLDTPVCWGAGIPYGLYAEENDTDMAQTMRNYLSITQGFGTGATTPPIIGDDANIITTGAPPAGYTLSGSSPVMLERTLDGTGNVAQRFPAGRAPFKGGKFGLTVAFKGLEVSEDLYTYLRNNVRLREKICRECGIAFPQRGSH